MLLRFAVCVEGGVEEAQQRPEALLNAAVGGGGYQDDVPAGAGGEVADQGVALLLPALLAGSAWPRRGVGLVHDDEVGGVSEKRVAVAFQLDEVDADHQVAVVLVEGDVLEGQAPFQPPDPGRLDHGGPDVELRPQLLLPLLAEMGGAQDADAAHRPPVQQLTGDHGRFDGLADSHIIGDQQAHRILAQGHDQRHELIGPRDNRQPAHRPERARPAPKAEADRITEQQRSGEIARLLRVGRFVLGGLDGLRFQRPVDAHRLGVRPVDRPQPDDVRQVGVGGQHHPVPPPGGHQLPGGENRFGALECLEAGVRHPPCRIGYTDRGPAAGNLNGWYRLRRCGVPGLFRLLPGVGRPAGRGRTGPRGGICGPRRWRW